MLSLSKKQRKLYDYFETKITSDEADLLRESLQNLADQINKKGKKIEQPTKATSTKPSE